MAFELKKKENDRIGLFFLSPIVIAIIGISVVVIAYLAAGWSLFDISSNSERLELTKLIVTSILGTGAIIQIIDKIKWK